MFVTIIDEYLREIDEPQKRELERIRMIAKKVVPDAEEVISYGMPTLKYKNKSFLGFNLHKNHIGIYPYGGEEIEVFNMELAELHYSFSSGAIRIPFDKPIPETLLKKNYKAPY